MLKIVRSVDEGAVRLILSGRIDQAELTQLEHSIAREATEARALTLDLEDVRLLDREAVRFLVRCEAAGIQLINAAAYIRKWMKAERRHSTDESLNDASSK